MSTIFKVSGSVGSGKTYAICELFSKEYSKRCAVYAAPTLALLEQTADTLRNMGVTPIVVHSGQRSPDGRTLDPTTERLSKALSNAGVGDKVLCTHPTLMQYLGTNSNEAMLKQWSCFIDEEYGIVDRYNFQTTISDLPTLAAMFSTELAGHPVAWSIAHGMEDEAKAVVEGTPYDDSMTAPKYREIVKRVLSPLYQVWGKTTDSAMNVTTILDPTPMYAFQEVVLMSALMERTFTALIWEKQFNINMEHMELPRPLGHCSHSQGHRMKIHYLFPGGVNASLTKLSAENVALEVADTVSKHWEGQEFLYTCNEKLTDTGGSKVQSPIGIKLGRNAQAHLCPPIAHGLNTYQHLTNVAALAVTQPDGTTASVVATLSGQSVEDVLALYRMQTVYQTVGRTAIRTKNSDEIVNVVVLDKAAADTLAEVFKGAEVIGKLGDVNVNTSAVPVRSRPKDLSREEWKATKIFLNRNRNRGEAGTLPTDKQHRYDRYSQYVQ